MVAIVKKIIIFLISIGFIETRQTGNDKLFCNTDTSEKSGKRSCANALWNNGSEFDSCYMWFAGSDKKKDSSECDAWPFKPDEKSEMANISQVKLRAFYELNKDGTHAGINVTFSDIKWKSMFMRFKEDGRDLRNICREFTILSSTPIAPGRSLFYDCIWKYGLDTRDILFDIKASDGSLSTVRNFKFKYPNTSHINPENAMLNQSELFMYIDLTYLPLVKLHLQTAKDRFDIGSDNYEVVLHSEPSGQSGTILEPEIKGDDEITYHLQTLSRRGKYYFTAQIKHINCTEVPGGCYVSKSPTIIVKGNPYRDVVLIAIAGCGAVVLSVLSFVYFLWRLRNNSLNAPRPTVLLVYTATAEKHTRAVVEFARFLRKFCHVEALVDELGIPETKSKDPFTWCTDSFSKANAIMVVASPHVACVHYERIYRNIDALSLRLLREKIADKKLEMKYLTAVFPYCLNNDTGVPQEAKHLRRFYLPSNLAKMLTYLHTGSSSYHRQFCITPLIEAGLSEMNSTESDFVKAIKEAEGEIRAGVEKCNHCSGANTDHEGGPLLALKFVSIDVPREPADDQPLTWPSIKHVPLQDEMFPGPIEQLNLLGSEGVRCNDVSPARNSVKSGLNLNELDLG